MMNDNLSLSDIAAVTRNDGDYGNGWFIWLILIFAVFSNNGWGNGINYATSADVQRSTEQVQTNARFDSLFNNQSRNAMDNLTLIDRNAMDNANLIAQNRYDNAILIKDVQYNNLQNLNNMTGVIERGFDNNAYAMANGFNNVDKSICNGTFAITQTMNDGFNGVNQNLCNLSHQISDGVCAIKTQLLQDKYDQLLNNYNLSTMANANAVQTQNILGALGSWYAKPPYVPYATCGYYNNYNGTTIA